MEYIWLYNVLIEKNYLGGLLLSSWVTRVHSQVGMYDAKIIM